MRKFLGSLFGNESEVPPASNSPSSLSPSSSSSSLLSSPPAGPRKVYGDNPTPDSEVVLKIVFIGGASAGKTSIVRRYLQACFTHQHIPTIGIDLSTAKLQSKGNPNAEYRIQFWDVSHAEVRGKLHKHIFKGAVGIVMVFDCNNVKSVTAVDEWRLAYENTVRNTAERVPMVLLANKSDVGPPVIKPSDLDTYCERGGYATWRLTSARSGTSVIEALDKLLDLSIEFREQQQQANTRRRRPEKLITTKSQLLSPPMRASGTTSTAGTPLNISSSNVSNASSTLGNSMGISVASASQYGASLSSSSGTDNNNNGSYMSSSFTPTTTYTMRNYSSSNSSSSRPSNVAVPSSSVKSPELTSPGITSPLIASSSFTSKTRALVHAEIPVYSGNPLSPSLVTDQTTLRTIPSPPAPLSLDNKPDTNATSVESNSNINNNVDKTNDESLDASSTAISENQDKSSTSSTPPSSSSTSTSVSSHASQRTFGGEKGIRTSSSMEFGYFHGDARPSILSMTNALAVQELKLDELMNLVEEFYTKLKTDLDQLFMNVKPSRKSDLQILEFQRFDEYIKLLEALRAHKEKLESEENENNQRKLAPEHLQVLLSENMKKWNQLVINLNTEVSLYKSGVFDSEATSSNSTASAYTPLSSASAMMSPSRPVIPVPGSSLKSSASDTNLYGRGYESGPGTGSTSRSATGGNSPNKSKDHSALLTPPILPEGDPAKRQQPNSARRMGFGFKNVGKNPSAILQLVSPNPTTSFSLDNDNISSPPSPYNSVHSPTPSSPSTSPNSSPPFYSSSSNTPSSVSSHDSHFRAHMEANGKTQKKNAHHTRSSSAQMQPIPESSISSSVSETVSSPPPSPRSTTPPFHSSPFTDKAQSNEHT